VSQCETGHAAQIYTYTHRENVGDWGPVLWG